jgi:hypothetical protein
MGRGGRVVVDQGHAIVLVRTAVPAAARELGRREARAQPARHGGAQHDGGEGHVREIDGHKAGQRHGPQDGRLGGGAQRTRADPVHRLQHDGRHSRLDAVEQASHQRQLAEHHINPAERDQDEQGGQHEQHAGHDTARRAVHQPADVGGKLLGLGAG